MSSNSASPGRQSRYRDSPPRRNDNRDREERYNRDDRRRYDDRRSYEDSDRFRQRDSRSGPGGPSRDEYGRDSYGRDDRSNGHNRDDRRRSPPRSERRDYDRDGSPRPDRSRSPPHGSESKASAFLDHLASRPTREWAEGWVSKGPPVPGEERPELKDNLNETLVKNVFHGWNPDRLSRMRQSLAERQARSWVNVWSADSEPPPPSESLEVSDKHRKKKDKSKHKRKEKDKDRRRSKEKKHRRRYSSDSDSSSSSDRRSSRRKHGSSKKRERQVDHGLDEMLMDESKREEFDLMQEMLAKKRKLAEDTHSSSVNAMAQQEEVEDDVFGPAPIKDVGLAKGYNAAMLPGEADAYAQYVQDNKRIPRRGEIGLTADEIEGYEKLGYQMSGSRHRRMNAVRIRKEGQIYSHEEQRQLAQHNLAERQKRENQVVADFRTMLSTKLKEHTPAPSQQGRD